MRVSGCAQQVANIPIFTSDDTPSVTSPSQTVLTVAAIGAGTIIYAIAGGVDAALFAINSSTGALTFASASVAGTYAVRVSAKNSGGTAYQDITTTVEAGYVAGAVVFDGSGTQHINIASLAVTNSNKLSLSFWYQWDTPQSSAMLYCVAPAGSANCVLVLDGNFRTSTDDGHGLQIGPSPDDVPFGPAWHHILFSTELNGASGANAVWALYIDGVDAKAAWPATLNSTPAVPQINGRAFAFGSSDDFGGYYNAGVSDFWFAPNVSLLTAGDIAPSTLAKFISGGKPVNPTGFPSGGSILFSGNATTFAVNQLSGGAAVLTGVLTNAPTSPSD